MSKLSATTSVWHYLAILYAEFRKNINIKTNSNYTQIASALKMTTAAVDTVSQDIDMEVDATAETLADEKKNQDLAAVQELREQIRQIEKSVASKESR